VFVILNVNGQEDCETNKTLSCSNSTDQSYNIFGTASVSWKTIYYPCSASKSNIASTHSKSNPNTPIGLIVGATVGAAAGLAIVGFFSRKLYKNKFQKNEIEKTNVEMPTLPTTQVSAPQVSAPPVSTPQVSTRPVSIPPVSTPPVSAPPVSTTPVSEMHSTNNKREEPPRSIYKTRRIFISYCWRNSKQAEESNAIGKIDPRDISMEIENIMEEKCWTDFDISSGGHALFSSIQIGIQEAEVVVICISDDYAKSKSCEQELTYATKTCKKHIIPVVVGETMEWQTYRESGCGILLSTELYIDFRDASKFNSNMKALIARLRKILSKEY